MKRWKLRDRVVIRRRYSSVGLGGKVGTVVDTRYPEGMPEVLRDLMDPEYPYADGMVRVHLDDPGDYGCPAPWITPNDLAHADGEEVSIDAVWYLIDLTARKKSGSCTLDWVQCAALAERGLKEEPCPD